MTTPDEAARQPKVPTMAHFGVKDHWIPLESVEAFRKAHPEVEVHVYKADHGFNCDQRASHDATAAKLARAGVAIGAGTDIWQLPDAIHMELEELVAAGLSPAEAIRAGTVELLREPEE